LLSQTTPADFAALEADDPTILPAGFPVGEASDAELQDAVFGSAPSRADSNNAGGVIALDDGLSVAPSDADLDYAWLGDDYGLSISGLEIGPQDLYATRPVSERLGVGEPTALAQFGEGAYNKLQAQWGGVVNAWNQLTTDPINTLIEGTGAVLSFAGNAVYDTALYVSDQLAVSSHYLTSGLIPATDALQRNVDRAESVFGGVYNIEQAVDNKDYGLAGGLAVEGFEAALLTLLTRGRGQLDTPNVLKQTGGGNFTGSADELYDVIRSSETDVSTIAQNTGFKPTNIQKVKDHVFYNEHLLDKYVDYGVPAERARFDSDLSQAQAWQRLETGTHTDADITWLKHETAERWYELRHNSGYTKAHSAAENKWTGNPWGEN
jgi:hypothetical protein